MRSMSPFCTKSREEKREMTGSDHTATYWLNIGSAGGPAYARLPCHVNLSYHGSYCLVDLTSGHGGQVSKQDV